MQKLKRAIRRNPRLRPLYNRLRSLKGMARRLIRQGACMEWSYVVLEDKKVVYLVVQKVACTSIKASMTGIQSDQDYLSVHEQALKTGHVLYDLDPERCRGYYTFTFVRNPFERLISCYENKYHTDRPLRRSGPVRIGMKYDSYLLGFLSADRGFRSFVRRVCSIPDRIADEHFVSQSFLIDRMGKNPKPDFIGHFEHLEAEYEPIRQRFGFTPLPHHNRTPRSKDWMDYYDLSTARMVYRRYREDIQRFGYQDAYDALIRHLSEAHP